MRLLERLFSWFGGASRTIPAKKMAVQKRTRPSRKGKAMTAEVIQMRTGRTKKASRPTLRRPSNQPVLALKESGPALFGRLGQTVGILAGHRPGQVLLSVPVSQHQESHRGVLTMDLALVLKGGKAVPLTDLCLERDGRCHPLRLQARPTETVADALRTSTITHLRVVCGAKTRDIPNIYHGG